MSVSMLRCEGESHPNMVLTPMILQLPKPQPFWCSDTALLLHNTPGPTAVTGTDELDSSELVLNMAHYDFIYPTLPWDGTHSLTAQISNNIVGTEVSIEKHCTQPQCLHPWVVDPQGGKTMLFLCAVPEQAPWTQGWIQWWATI